MGKSEAQVIEELTNKLNGRLAFSAKLAKFGQQGDKERRVILIPKDQVDEAIKKFGDKKIKVTLEFF